MGLDLFAQLSLDGHTLSGENAVDELSQVLPLKGSASYALEAFGEAALGERMYADMDSYEATAFAADLHAAAARIEQRQSTDGTETAIAGWSKEDALTAIREAADWYQRVGTLQCSVHAWF